MINIGPFHFLTFINDIVRDINSHFHLFADDTSFYMTVEDPVTAAMTLNTDLKTVSNRASKWLVKFNQKQNKLNRLLSLIQEVTSHKHLDSSCHEI